VPYWRFWYRGTPNHPLQQTGRAMLASRDIMPKQAARLLSLVVR
jgi:hypothetical protein